MGCRSETLACASAAAGDELARDPHLHRLLGAAQAASDAVEPTRWDSRLRIDVVQLPAQPLLSAPALVDQVVSVIGQQL